MSDQQVKIGKYSFEIGFDWGLISKGKGFNHKDALREKGHTCYAFIQKDDSFAGSSFGSKDKKAFAKKSHSLAAFVFEWIENDFGKFNYIFLKELDSGDYYYFSVDNGFIQPGSDITIGVEEARRHIALADENRDPIYLDSPNAHHVSDGAEFNEVSVEDTISSGVHKPNNSTLTRGLNDTRDNIIRYLSTGVLVIASVVAIYYAVAKVYEKWEENQVEVRSVKTKAERELEELNAKKTIVAQRLLQKTKSLRPADLTRSCINTFFSQGGAKDIGGWKVLKMECAQSGLSSEFEQLDLRSFSKERFTQEVTKHERVRVNMSPNGQWLSKATIKNQSGFVGNKIREGMALSGLPSSFDIEKTVMAKLRDLKMKGYYFGNIRVGMEIFSEEQDIPDEINYFVGQVAFVLSSLDQVQMIAEMMDYDYVQAGKIELYSQESVIPTDSTDKSLKYIFRLNYFYR